MTTALYRNIASLLVPCAVSVLSLPVHAQVCTQFELQITAPDPAFSDTGEINPGYGQGIAISDPWFFIGADSTDLWGVWGPNSGSIYTYLRAGDQLEFRDFLTPWDAVGGEFMGEGLATDGQILVAGAIVDDLPCPWLDPPDDDCGSAYVFWRDDRGTPPDLTDDEWVPYAKLVAPDPEHLDWFGLDTAVYGDWIVVGASKHACAVTGSGSAFVYYRDDNGTPSDPNDDTWSLHTELTSPGVDGNPNDHFGFSVAIWENRVVVTTLTTCGFAATSDDPGKAYVFRRDDPGTPEDVSDDVWALEATLMPVPGESEGGDQFGYSVDMEDDLIVVGMPGDSTFDVFAGSVYVFRRNDRGTPSDESDDVWYLETRLASGNYPDTLGDGVSISGNRVLGGGSNNIDEIYTEGAGFVFRYAGGQWHAEQRLLGSDLDGPGAQLGHIVALDGEWIVLSQFGTHQNLTHHAYFYHVDADCNGNCVSDEDELAAGAADCNNNGVPDDCDADCQPNGMVDECEVAGGTVPDVNGNLVPDVCEDCNNNGIVDSFDIAGGFSFDCNYNGVPAECETECSGRGPCMVNGCACPSNFTGPGCEFCAPDHYSYPECVYCDPAVTCLGRGTCHYLTGQCVCVPQWTGPNCDTVPCVTDADCDDGDPCTNDVCAAPDCTNDPQLYGDVNDDGGTDVFDILCVLDGFAGVFTTCAMPDVDLIPCTPDGLIDIFDILAVLDAFGGTILCCDIP